MNSEDGYLASLLTTLGDDLALPLLQVRAGLELVMESSNLEVSERRQLDSLSQAAQSGLQLVDAYRLAFESRGNSELLLEPVSLSGVLRNVADELGPLASHYSTDLWVDAPPRLRPILAHRSSLIATLRCLTLSTIRSQAGNGRRRRYQVVLAAHRNHGDRLTAGIFSKNSALGEGELQAARKLAGRARQPMPSLPYGTAAGVLIADKLCTSMNSRLRPASHHDLHGLAATFLPSRQLRLV